METKSRTEEGLIKGVGLILIVDDEPIMRKIMINVLKNSGYRVISAENGDQAVEFFQKHMQDIRLVVLDLLMPNKSGKETFLELKQIRPDVKVLLVSGNKKDQSIREMLNLGVRGFLSKPFTFPQLSEAVFDAILSLP